MTEEEEEEVRGGAEGPAPASPMASSGLRCRRSRRAPSTAVLHRTSTIKRMNEPTGMRWGPKPDSSGEEVGDDSNEDGDAGRPSDAADCGGADEVERDCARASLSCINTVLTVRVKGSIDDVDDRRDRGTTDMDGIGEEKPREGSTGPTADAVSAEGESRSCPLS